MEDNMNILKVCFILVLIGIVNQAYAVECTLSVTEASTKTTESIVFNDKEEINTVTLRHFSATYYVDNINKIESLALTLPSGSTSAPYYKLGSLPKMGILAQLENGDTASFICIR